MPYKPTIGTIWLGPLDDRAQVLHALKRHHAGLKLGSAFLPKKQTDGYQHIADNVRRKLGNGEVMGFPDIVNQLARDFPCFHDVARNLLSSLEGGGDVWEWGIDPNKKTNGGYSYSYGWCVVRDGLVVASLCHSTS